MEVFIAILRGINVSGKNKIPMAELRDILAPLGWRHLQTYIQSGNLVFQTEKQDHVNLATIIHEKIKGHFGYEIPVLVLNMEDLEMTVRKNPYGQADLSKLHVTFLANSPAQDKVENLPPSPNPKESYQVMGKQVYVYCPDGYGRTKLNNMFFEKKLGVTATTRNWKTCLKLLEITNDFPEH